VGSQEIRNGHFTTEDTESTESELFRFSVLLCALRGKNGPGSATPATVPPSVPISRRFCRRAEWFHFRNFPTAKIARSTKIDPLRSLRSMSEILPDGRTANLFSVPSSASVFSVTKIPFLSS
jgi:hypothetical protein